MPMINNNSNPMINNNGSDIDDVQTYNYIEAYGTKQSIARKKFDSNEGLMTNISSSRGEQIAEDAANEIHKHKTASMLMQFFLLYKRNLVAVRRNYVSIFEKICVIK